MSRNSGVFGTAWRLAAGFIVVLLTLTSCSPDYSLQPLSNQAVILAFGDSLTFGKGAPADSSYPHQLAQKIPQKIINSGISGEETSAGLPRLKRYLDKQPVDLVLLCHGGNDMLRKRDLEVTESRLVEMVNTIKDSGSEVVIIAVPKPGLFLSDHDMYKRVSEQTQSPLLSDVFSDVLSDSRLRADPAHPNADGYKVVAERIYSLLDKAGAL